MTYAIIKDPDIHLGFLLFASPPEAHNCIFQVLPLDSEHFEFPETKHLLNLKALGELSWAEREGTIHVFDRDKVELAVIANGRMETGGYNLRTIKLSDRSD